MTEFKWHPGSHIKADPQSIGERLADLHAAHGHLTPHTVLDDARDPESPLHNAFEWDDGAAAEAHRLNQARRLVARIRIVPRAAAAPLTVRAYVHVRQDRQPVYLSSAVAMTDPDSRDQVLRRALRELKQWRERYREIEDLAAIFDQMDVLEVVA